MRIPIWLFVVGVIVLFGGGYWLGAFSVARRIKENAAWVKYLAATPKDCSEDGSGHC